MWQPGKDHQRVNSNIMEQYVYVQMEKRRMIIDFHAHILPGLDHGCNDVLTAVRQLQMAKKAGVDIVVATSHFYPHIDSVENFLFRRQKSWDMLQDKLPQDVPHIILGAETLICEGIEKMEGLADLACEGSSTILIEMPSISWKSIYGTVEKINELFGGHVVVAHIERYEKKSVENLFNLGVSGQINIESFCKLKQKKHLLRWSENGAIAALGSDIHGTTNVYKKLRKVQNILDDKFMQIMQSSEKLLFSDSKINNNICI